MTEAKSVIEIVKELGPWVSGIIAAWWFLSRQVWPWLSVRIDKNSDFQQEIRREEMVTQRSLSASFQQLTTAFIQLTELVRRNETMLTDIHERIVSTDNQEVTE